MGGCFSVLVSSINILFSSNCNILAPEVKQIKHPGVDDQAKEAEGKEDKRRKNSGENRLDKNVYKSKNSGSD